MAYPWTTTVTDAIARLAAVVNASFASGAHRTNFSPRLNDVATVSSALAEAADYANTNATAAALSETSAAASAAKLAGTSTTSVLIGTGSKSFTTQAGKFFDVGARLLVASGANAANYMFGTVTAYDSGTGALTVEVSVVGGSGTLNDWNIRVSGERGSIGVTGSAGPAGATGAAGSGYTATSTTSLLIGSGSKAFTTQAGLAYTVGARARATDTANTANWMEGLVVAYSSTTLTITADLTGGSGTIASWNINLAGERGVTGSTGAIGSAGGAIAIPYTFSTTTADADPGAGNLRLDQATQNTAATIRVDELDNLGSSWASVIDAFEDSTTTGNLGQARIFQANDLSKFLIFKVTAVGSESGYRNITVAIVGSSAASPFANGAAVMLAFTRTGDAGAGSGDVVGPATATNNAYARFDGTTGKLLKNGAATVPYSDLTGTPTIPSAASQITFPPAGGIAATDVEGAIDELDTEKAPKNDSVLTGTTDISQAFKRSGVISPAQITANTNDYNPTGLSTASVLRLNTDASRDLTGIVGGAAGRELKLINVGSFNIVLKNDVTSTAANRFLMTADITLAPNHEVDLWWDTTSQRWRPSAIVTITPAGAALLDDASAAAQRTTLGLVAVASSGSAADLSTGTLPDARLSAAATPFGVQSVWIPAGAMKARTTNGAAAGTVETTTNKVMINTLDFDTTTQEFAQFSIRMPASWNEGTVTFSPVWSHAATTTNFGVSWAIQAAAISNDDAGDAAFAGGVASNDTGGTTNDFYEGPTSAACTVGGSPAAGDLVVFQVMRAPSDAADTMAIDARLHGIVLNITTDAGHD